MLQKIYIVISLVYLTSCSAQNWYQGAQNTQTIQCMNRSSAEYNDCMQQQTESYNEYEKRLDELKEENSPN